MSKKTQTIANLGENIKRVRMARGLTQVYIAKVADISLKRYRLIEQGLLPVDCKTLFEIARALGISSTALKDF